MKYLLVMLITLVAFSSAAQNESGGTYNQDLFLTVDNDAFLAQAVDRYYSSGIFFRYRKLIKPENWLARLGGSQSNKAIYSLGFSHLFYTPSDLKLRTIDQFDRPYAGAIAAHVGIQYIRKERERLRVQLEAGVMGPAAGVEGLQTWYHEIIGAKTPRGWQFQIENTPLISLDIEYQRSLVRGRKTELTGEALLKAGTVFNLIGPGMGFRWGKLQSTTNSSFYRARLGSISKGGDKSSWKESYFFVKTFLNVIPFDASIEGNFIGRESLHTEEAQRIRYHVRYGWVHALNRWDLGLSFNNVGRETRESRGHYYVTIDVLFRL